MRLAPHPYPITEPVNDFPYLLPDGSSVDCSTQTISIVDKVLPEGIIADFIKIEKIGDEWQLVIAPINIDQTSKSYTLTLAVHLDFFTGA